MTKKEEFEKIIYSNEFGHIDGHEWMIDKTGIDLLWSFIENEIRQAKIEELKKISELRLEYPSKNLGKWDTIMVGYMEERVSELEKEKI